MSQLKGLGNANALSAAVAFVGVIFLADNDREKLIYAAALVLAMVLGTAIAIAEAVIEAADKRAEKAARVAAQAMIEAADALR